MNKSNGPNFANHSANAPSSEPANSGFLHSFFGHIKVSLIATVVLAVVVSGIYPVVVWGLSQVLFHNKANGSLIGKDGQPVSDDKDAAGSALLGQNFSDGKYFHPRPSAAGSGYDPTASGGSNLGPTSAKLMFGTTKNGAITILAHDKTHPAADMPGRIEGTIVSVTGTTIAISSAGANGTATTQPFALAAALADPATAVNSRGRTIKVTTLTAGTKVEVKLNDKTPPAVTAISVIDSQSEGVPSSVDTTANTLTLPGAAGTSPTVINVPSSATIIVNGKADAKLADVTTDMNVRVLVSTLMDYDGIADRIIHYCEDNGIPYQSSIPAMEFKDADGVDDAKLVLAFNAASTPPTITPTTPVPADAVTASGSGLDPHISPANAMLQAKRVADARKVTEEKVKAMIEQFTEGPSLGIFGDPGVNVLRLNLALDRVAPVAAPSTAPATNPTTGP